MTTTATAEIERLARAIPGRENWEAIEDGAVIRWEEGQEFDVAFCHTDEISAYIAAVSPDVVLGLIAALRAAEAERDAAVASEREACARLAIDRAGMVPSSTKAFRSYQEACKAVARDIFARAALQSTSAKEGG